MDRKEVIFWRDKYDTEEDLYNKGTEEKLRAKFKEKSHLTKGDLEEIIGWKFQGRLLGRRKINLVRLRGVEEGVIRKVTALAFEMPTDKLKLKLLTGIDGVGISVASVILTFYDPDNYGVLDFHVWHGLYGSDKKVFTEQECLKYFRDLRTWAREVGLPCRDVEKAIFKKDIDQQKARK
jgi:hypothetical protein